MKRFQEFLYSLHPFLLSSVAGVLTVAQIILAFFFNRPGSEALEWAGVNFLAGIIRWLRRRSRNLREE